MEARSPSKSKLQIAGFTSNPRTRKFVTIAILTILISGIISGCLIFKEQIYMPEKMSTYFTVVIDCGSTGSRVNVYEWMIKNGRKDNRKLPILLRSYPENVNNSTGCHYHCIQTEPGLHNFVNDAYKLKDSLIPLIRFAEKWVPLDRHSVTPIFVLATAGMRTLVEENVNRVLSNVLNVVKEHGFLCNKKWIRVLTGKEEAYYGWVALNYQMGVFGNYLKTFGLLDLGGSSLQVVAELDDSSKNKHSFRSKIGLIEPNIVAYSFPAFGLNEAFDRTIAMLSHSPAIKESGNGVLEIRHPCLGSGFVKNYTCRGCFGLDSSNSEDLSGKENGLNSVFLVGEPDWERCKVIARSAAINSSSLRQVYDSKCIGFSSYAGDTKLNLTKTSNTVTRYHALSGFFAVSHALNLSPRVNRTSLWESGQSLCSRSWSDQTSVNEQYCFKVPYVTSLIENALCLEGAEIIFGPGNVSWTLGASLIEGEFLWLQAENPRNGFWSLKENVIIASPLLTFVLLLFLLFIVYSCQIKLPMLGRKVAGHRSLPSYIWHKPH